MKLRFHRSGLALERWGIILLFWALSLACGAPAAETGASPGTNAVPEPAAIVAHLEYKELGQGFLNRGVALSTQTEPFAKEPPWNDRHVVRGQFRIGTNASQHLSFAWNRGLGQLHLDLNRNRDLTDDPEGVVSCRRFPQDFDTQVFTNVHLLLATATGERRCLVDVHLFNRRGPEAYLNLRSLWEGQITLQGRSWQIGLVENLPVETGSSGRGYLLLRPWALRDQPLDSRAWGTGLETFPFPAQVFIQNQAYALAGAFETSGSALRYKVEFKEQQPKLGQLKLQGQFVDRLIFLPGPCLVILDEPGPVVRVPLGTYPEYRVQLKQGEKTARREWGEPGAGKPLTLSEDQAAVLALGGPLTNSVTVQRRGRRLVLNQRLVGADGSSYRLDQVGPREPPGFTVYQGDKTLTSGKFEFG